MDPYIVQILEELGGFNIEEKTFFLEQCKKILEDQKMDIDKKIFLINKQIETFNKKDQIMSRDLDGKEIPYNNEDTIILNKGDN